MYPINVTETKRWKSQSISGMFYYEILVWLIMIVLVLNVFRPRLESYLFMDQF